MIRDNFDRPHVSINVITYNHEKYLEQCLESILMQKVNFTYEVLIHDDASKDRTQDIIKTYVSKYPNIIKPIYQTRNQYSKGIHVSRFNEERALGKYIAQCEGDDYWIDANKLQKQVDFLEKNLEYIGTTHSYQFVDKNGEKIPKLERISILSGVFTMDDIKYYRYSGPTASLVYRNIFATLGIDTKDRYYACAGYGDQKLIALLAMYGNVYCFSECMSAYRYVTMGSDSYHSLMKDKNVYGDNYRHLIEISEFAQNNFMIDLHLQAAAFCIYCAAILKYLRTPSSQNRLVLSLIRQINLSNQSYHKSIIANLVKHPISFVQIIFTIAIERYKRRKILAATGF